MKQLQEFDGDFLLKRTNKVWHLIAYVGNKIDFQIESLSLGDILSSLEKLKKPIETSPIIINKLKRKYKKSVK